MLKIYVGYHDKVMESPDGFFQAVFDKKLLLGDFCNRAVKEIDLSDVIGEYAIKSPVLGGISPVMLSTGCKCAMISMYYPEKVILPSMFGGNCMPFICEAAMDHDILISMDYLYQPYRHGYRGKVLFINNNKVVDNAVDFHEVYDELGGI